MAAFEVTAEGISVDGEDAERLMEELQTVELGAKRENPNREFLQTILSPAPNPFPPQDDDSSVEIGSDPNSGR